LPAVADRDGGAGIPETAGGAAPGGGAASGGEPSTEEGREPAWDEVLAARRVGRPTGIDVAAALCSSWTELASTDPVTRAGLATVAGRRVVVVAHDRYAADGRPRPAGYRLAQRAVVLAGRLGLPLVTLIDTPGADPSPASEAGGVAPEMARTFAALATLPTPSVAVCVGEGGSGGALALAHADRFLIQRHAVFSVIGPEGAAAILERDAAKAPQVAPRLKLTSADLAGLGIVDAVVDDEVGATVAAIIGALDEARVGDRDRRVDEASRRALDAASLNSGAER
jgi:acetyl-CoA carboxylase carboxyl transferase subunit beta